jgi:hypothetical protein
VVTDASAGHVAATDGVGQVRDVGEEERGARGDAATGQPTAAAPRDVQLADDVPPPQLTVHKRNDADRDGVFSDVEEVSGSGAAVPFRVGIRNLGDVPLTIVSVTDTIGATTLDLLEDHCPQLVTTLEPGGHVPCTFTLDRYLRTYDDPPRSGLTNVVRVVATDGTVEVTAEDTSTVLNPNAGKVSAAVMKTNDADGDGVFTTDEVAGEPGQPVTFQVVVHNTSPPGTARIVSLTDTWAGLDEPIDLLALCPALGQVQLRGIGGGHDDGGHDEGGGCGDDEGGCGGDDHGDDGHDEGGCGGGGSGGGGHDGDDGGCGGDDHADDGHDEGGCGGGGHDGDDGDDGHSGGCGGDGGGARPSSLTCTFTLPGYAPPVGSSVTNTVTVILAKPHDPDATAIAVATSTVATPTEALGSPAIVLQKRVGPTGGTVAVHDQPPGLLVTIPEVGASLTYGFEVTNTGAVPLTDLVLEDAAIDLAGCTLPEVLPPGEAATCLSSPVPAVPGDHVNEARVRAVGAGLEVEAAAVAHYRGILAGAAGPEQPPDGDEGPSPGTEVASVSKVRSSAGTHGAPAPVSSAGAARLATTGTPLLHWLLGRTR